MSKIILIVTIMLLAQTSAYAETKASKENVAKLYVATFDRAPDAAGLSYWVDKSNLSLEGVAESFFDQSETQSKYTPDASNTDFVSAIYRNLFNREAEEAGLDYWVSELNAGRVDKSVFILAVINGAKDTSLGNDSKILTNKTTVGLAFSDAGLDDIDDATNILKDVTDEQQTVTDALATLLDAPSAQTIIDVLVLYDSDVENLYSDVSARVNHLFYVSNTIYKDSGLNIAINVKNILHYNTTTSPALEEIANDEEVQAVRVQNKADMVLIYQENKTDGFGLCGIAYRPESYDEEDHFESAMFSQVYANCPVDVTAHELGHNMGLGHSQLQDGSNLTPFSYGLGHGVDGKFATVMAYAFEFNTENQILKFSSPDYECVTGFPCGIAVGQSGEAHATKVIEFTAPKIAKLY